MEYLKLNIQFFASNSAKNSTLESSSGNTATITTSFEEQAVTEENIKNNTTTIYCEGTYTQNTGYWSQIASPYLRLYWYDDNKHKEGTLVKELNVTAIAKRATKTVKGTIDVTHNPDGTLNGYTVTKWYYEKSNSLVPKSASVQTGLTKLTTIPRATKLSDYTGTIGKTMNITWTKASTSFTHKLEYSFEGTTGTIGTDLVDSVSWTPPVELYEKLTTKSGTGKLLLTTYNSETQVGETQEATLTLNAIENDVKAVVSSAEVTDTNANTTELTNSANVLVLNKSIANINLSFNTRHYATASKVTINNVEIAIPNGTLQSDKKTTNYVINQSLGVAKTATFNVKITDSRGYTTEYPITNESINYIPLDSNIIFKRIAPTTGEVGVKFNGNYFDGSFGKVLNTLKISYKYKKKNDNDYSNSITLVENTDYKISNNTYYSGVETEANQIKIAPLFDYRSVYEVVMYVEDKLTTLTTNILVVKGIPIIWWNSEKVTVNGELYIADNDGNDPKTIFDLIYPIGSIYTSVNSTNPKYLFGGTWEQLKDRFLLGAGNTYSAGSTGGAATVKLTAAQSGVPAHVHGASYSGANFYIRHGATEGTASVAAGVNTSVETGVGDTWGNGFEKATYSHKIDRLNIGGTVSVSQNTAVNASAAHENMPPYLTVYMWKRTG